MRSRSCKQLVVVLILVCIAGAAGSRAGAELLYATEGNRLRRLDIAALDRGEPLAEVFIENAPRDEGDRPGRSDLRRDINGTVCRLPDGSGRFIAGEDTGQPETPPGWGVFSADGVQVGKLTTTYRAQLGDPYGCAFDSQGRLFTSELGNAGFGTSLGQLIVWFPPFDHYPGPVGAYPDTAAVSGNFCKLADDIGTATGLAIDSEDRVYLASASRGAIYRFSPPFPSSPTAAGGCGSVDSLGSPMVGEVRREVFARGLYTFSGLAFAPDGRLYAASVFTGEILELDREGRLIGKVLEPAGWLPPFETGNPQGIALDSQGRLYYADLDLVWRFPAVVPGGNGKVRRIGFDAGGQPLAPEILLEGLAFPDGVAVHPGRLGPAGGAGPTPVSLGSPARDRAMP